MRLYEVVVLVLLVAAIYEVWETIYETRKICELTFAKPMRKVVWVLTL